MNDVQRPENARWRLYNSQSNNLKGVLEYTTHVSLQCQEELSLKGLYTMIG